MAKVCNKELAISYEMIDERECQRSEIYRMKKSSAEIKAAAVSSTAAVPPVTAVSSTTLQDLPIEVLDYILMKAVVKKVMNKKLAKCSWISCASRVIEPMRTVWSQWNYCLAKRWFKLVLSRTLKSKDPTPISVEIISTDRDEGICIGLAKLGNKICYLSGRLGGIYWSPEGTEDDYCLGVCDVEDSTRSERIDLPLMDNPSGIVACKRSNSIYIWQGDGLAVWRLILDWNGGCEVLPWTEHLATGDFVDFGVRKLSVLDDGNILVLRCLYKNEEKVNILSVHKPDGLVIRNIKLSPNDYLSNVSMKSNGNFVYAQLVCDGLIFQEIDQDGKEIRNVHWFHECFQCINGRLDLYLDSNDRMILLNGAYHLVFLDAELNFLENVQFGSRKDKWWDVCDIDDTVSCTDFDKETNEMIISAPSRFQPRGAPDYSANTESEFLAEAHEQLLVKDLPMLITISTFVFECIT